MRAEERQRRLCDLLGISRPVLGAPLARISGGRLVSAVARAGGLGFLGAGYGDEFWLETEVPLVHGQAFGVGLISWHMGEGALAGALSHRPSALWLSFGDPSPFLPEVRAAGVVAVCQVGRVGEAIAAVDAGADVIVVQGSEAGGHNQGGRSLFGLLPAVVDALPDVPVVAAGAIVDRRSFDAACALGAWGVAVGTALYATTEANDTPEAKARLVSASGDETIQSRVYDHVRGPLWPDEFVARTVQTELTDEWAGRETELPEHLEALRERYEEDVRHSNMDRRALFAGEGLDSIREIVPAASVLERFPVAVHRAAT